MKARLWFFLTVTVVQKPSLKTPTRATEQPRECKTPVKTIITRCRGFGAWTFFLFVCLFVIRGAASLEAGGGRWICKTGSVHEFPNHIINNAYYLWRALQFQAPIHSKHLSFFSGNFCRGRKREKKKSWFSFAASVYSSYRHFPVRVFSSERSRRSSSGWVRSAPSEPRQPFFFLTFSPEVMPFWLIYRAVWAYGATFRILNLCHSWRHLCSKQCLSVKEWGLSQTPLFLGEFRV